MYYFNYFLKFIKKYKIYRVHFRAIITEKLGKIIFVDCSLYWNRDKKYYKTGWRGKYSSDGGVLTNQAIHLLDTLIYNFGNISNFDVFAVFRSFLII